MQLLGWTACLMLAICAVIVGAFFRIPRAARIRRRSPLWRIFNLARAAPRQPKFWQFVRNEAEENSADLLLYGIIGDDPWWDDVGSKQFADELAAMGDVSEIRVRINSPGGDVFTAQAIYNLLKGHSARIVTHIDGLAASAASVVAMAGDEVIMPGNSMMMIHNPWSFAMGDAREMRKMAETLDQVRETIIAAYHSKTGMDRSKLISLLNAETWLTAEEAHEYGLADTIIEPIRVAASLLPGKYVVNGQEIDLTSMHVWPGALLATAKADVEDGEGIVAPEPDLEPDAEPAAGLDPDPAVVEPPVPESQLEEVEAAVNAERARIQAIDDLARGIVGADELIARAKYTEPMSAERFAIELVKSGAVSNAGLLNARRAAAGAAEIPAGNADLTTTAAVRAANAKNIAEHIERLRGGVTK